jgi:hypothetical protein
MAPDGPPYRGQRPNNKLAYPDHPGGSDRELRTGLEAGKRSEENLGGQRQRRPESGGGAKRPNWPIRWENATVLAVRSLPVPGKGLSGTLMRFDKGERRSPGDEAYDATLAEDEWAEWFQQQAIEITSLRSENPPASSAARRCTAPFTGCIWSMLLILPPRGPVLPSRPDRETRTLSRGA